MKRDIISINEELCNGCSACVSGCHEGALQMIDGKARIVSELYCDGLGACIGECPVGAITIEKREAAPYDEVAVMERIASNGASTILAHLKHLKEHNELTYLAEGVAYVKAHKLDVDLSELEQNEQPAIPCGCPGSMARSFVAAPAPQIKPVNVVQSSQLTHWPVQLHLLNPSAHFFTEADVLLAADCVAFAYADFHQKFLAGRCLAIACPKLDDNQEVYIDKLVAMIDRAQINTLTVAIMEVPCCGGLLHLAQMAAARATRTIPIKKIVVGVEGGILSTAWV